MLLFISKIKQLPGDVETALILQSQVFFQRVQYVFFYLIVLTKINYIDSSYDLSQLNVYPDCLCHAK